MRAANLVAAVLCLLGAGAAGCHEHSISEPGQCRYTLCYERADGTPALAYGVQAWFLSWSPEVSSDSPWSFRPAYPGTGSGPVGIFLGPYPEPCIENWLLGEPHGPIEVTVAGWTKIQGFAPVVTQPVATECGDRVTQIVEPIDDALDASQLCRQPFADDSACCVELTSVVGPDGPPVEDYWYRSGAGITPEPWGDYTIGEGGLPYGCETVVAGDLRPGTIVVYSEGYLPYIGCLDCGAYTIQLEPLP